MNWDYFHRNPQSIKNWKMAVIERYKVVKNIKNKKYTLTTQNYPHSHGTCAYSYFVRGGKILVRFHNSNLLWNEPDLQPLETHLRFHRSNEFAYFKNFAVGQNGRNKIQIQCLDRVKRKNLKGIGFCMKSKNEVFVLETEQKIVLYEIIHTPDKLQAKRKKTIHLSSPATRIKMDEYINKRLHSKFYLPKETKARLMVLHSDNSFSLYDAEEGRLIKTINTRSNEVEDFKFNSNKLIIENEIPGTLLVWNITDDVPTFSFNNCSLVDFIGESIIYRKNHSGRVSLITESSDQIEFESTNYPYSFMIDNTKNRNDSIVLFTDRTSLTCMKAKTESVLYKINIPAIRSNSVYMDWHQIIYISQDYRIVKIDFKC